MKLLLVEDEKLLSKNLSKGLIKLGYAVDCAYDGEEALYMYDLNNYDLIILDLNLPKIDGMDVLNKIRTKDNEIKILILSARNTVDDKIIGLNSGSNDYLSKPFYFGELEARINNLIRRKFSQEPVKLKCGNLTADTSAKKVFINNDIVILTKKEYSILEYLLYNQEKITSAEELIEHIWDSETDLFSNSFKFHIHMLRKKLCDFEHAACEIVTIRGLGYQIKVKTEDGENNEK